MRQYNLIKQELRFCLKYGIILMYVFFTVFYVILLSVLPEEVKGITATILIFTDPAAMGLFFMGAIVLLEKSQRVNCSLAVSPIKVGEYIGAKIVCLMILGVLIGLLISISSNNSKVVISTIAIALSSVIFSFWGLLIAQKTESLNEFMIATVPCEMIICIPAILYLFQILKQDLWMLHPGVSAIRLIDGREERWLLGLLSLLVWAIISYSFCYRSTRDYFKKMGGGKL